MLEIKDLSIIVNHKYIIKDLSLTLNQKDKLAIIGEEGNGKSTLLKAILGICDYAEVDGIINLKGNRIGYLEQSISNKYLKKTVYEYLFQNDEDYYDKIGDFYRYLEVFQFSDSVLNERVENLSGGEKVKVSILRLLLEDDDILLLDEPTNDLDIETLEWLENFINYTDKPIIYVSHDETLLSHTANMILHLEQINHKTDCRHTLLRSDYDSYVENRLRSIEKQTQVARSERRNYEKQQEKLRQVMQKVEHQQNTITRRDPHGGRLLKKKMHALKSQEKKLMSTSLTEIPDVEEGIHFFFEKVELPRTKVVLKLDIDELKIKEKVLARNVKLEVIGNEHLCIIGKNGVGKSTLMKKIYKELKQREDIKLGYMPQTYDDVLDGDMLVLEFIASSGNTEDVTKARTMLGNMKFTSDEMTGKIKNLSNGTKAKLLLMKLVLEKCNVLLLDEPTRNVSPLSNPMIRKVLKEYQGAIISISHDRKYMEEVVDTLYVLTKDGLKRIFNENLN